MALVRNKNLLNIKTMNEEQKMKKLIEFFKHLCSEYSKDWEIELSSEGCIEIEPKEDEAAEEKLFKSKK